MQPTSYSFIMSAKTDTKSTSIGEMEVRVSDSRHQRPAAKHQGPALPAVHFW